MREKCRFRQIEKGKGRHFCEYESRLAAVLAIIAISPFVI